MSNQTYKHDEIVELEAIYKEIIKLSNNISSLTGGSDLPIEVKNALLNANTPNGTNPYATLSDISTTANITDSIDKRFVTDANLIVIGNTSGTNTGDDAVNSLYSGLATSKQDALVSGTNIKTINGDSILGSGDMTVGGQVDILQIQMFI